LSPPKDVELPSPNIRRWTSWCKAAVVIAVSDGRLLREEACRRSSFQRRNFSLGKTPIRPAVISVCASPDFSKNRHALFPPRPRRGNPADGSAFGKRRHDPHLVSGDGKVLAPRTSIVPGLVHPEIESKPTRAREIRNS
jgi:Protein of unknown function (DUF1153)